jgi:hypothetical protein
VSACREEPSPHAHRGSVESAYSPSSMALSAQGVGCSTGSPMRGDASAAGLPLLFGPGAPRRLAPACVLAILRGGGARFGRRSCVAGTQLFARPTRVSGPP